MKKGFQTLIVLAFALGLYCLAPINNPPGAAGSTGPQGSPGISGSPGPTGSPGPNTIASTTEILKGDNAGGAVAATANTDYSNPAGVQALIDAALAGKGVIGTIRFEATNPIITPAVGGVIDGVTYNDVGLYDVTFTVNQPDEAYGVKPTAESATPVAWSIFNKTVSGFQLRAEEVGTPVDPTIVQVDITRLSQ